MRPAGAAPRLAAALRRRRVPLPRVDARGAATSSQAPAPATAPSAVAAGAVPARALLGLSPEFRDLLIARAASGDSVPVLYSNPGAYAQLGRLTDEVVAALPPPPRPLFPLTEAEHTARIARGFAAGLLFVLLAVYLKLVDALRDGGGNGARLELERRRPLLTRLLVASGALRDLSGLLVADSEREQLFRRVFRRYSVAEAPAMPTARALVLLRCLLIEYAGGAAGPSGAAAAGGHGSTVAEAAVSPAVASAAAATAALEACGLSGKAAVSETDFTRLFSTASVAQPGAVVFLACDGLFGVTAATPATLERLAALFDRLEQERATGGAFSATALADLACDAGFAADEAAAAAFLDDCAYLLRGPVAEPAPIVTVLRRDQFADFMAHAALAAGVREESIGDYLQTFELLHLSGLREAAGIAAS